MRCSRLVPLACLAYCMRRVTSGNAFVGKPPRHYRASLIPLRRRVWSKRLPTKMWTCVGLPGRPIALEGAAVKPTLLGLTRSSDSEGMYKAAHHVFHDLSRRSDLVLLLQPVLKAFEEQEPEVAVPVAAQKALKGLA